MKLFRHCLALLLMMPVSAFATFKFCDIYQGQVMNCSDAITIASNIPAYQDNRYRNCYIQAGNAIYCEGLTHARKFPVRYGEGYRDCDIRSGVVTSCTVPSNVSHFPVAIADDESDLWMRWLKSSLCLLPSAWKPDDCTQEPHLPEQITFL